MEELGHAYVKHPQPNFCIEFTAGAVGGFAGLVVGHPMDTVKILLQNASRRASVSDVTSAIRQAGLMNFFRGLTLPAFSYVAVNAVTFGSYKACVERLDRQEQSIRACLIAGACSGLIQLIPSVPIEIVKIHQQNMATSTDRSPSVKDCIRHIVRQRGLRGLYVGTSMHALRDIPGFAVYFLAYAKLYSLNTWLGLPSLWSSFFGGAVGGAVSWIVSLPFDVVKTRMQSGEMHTFSEVIKDMIRQNNYRVFFRGLHVVLLRAFIVNGCSFAVFEWSLSRLRLWEHARHPADDIKPIII